MGRFRKIRFQNMVFLYSICLVAIFLFAEFIFMANTRIEIPEQMKGYYVSADHMMLTEQGFLISWRELEQRVVTEQEIHALFAPYYMKGILRAAWIVLFASLLFFFLFAYILTHKIIKPIEKTADALKYIRKKSDVWNFPFPKELSDIAHSFWKIKEEMDSLYADFENLSSFISHEQKNSLALLKTIIQNEYPAIGERAVAQLDHMVKNLDDILTLSSNVEKLEKVDLALVSGMAADEYRRVYDKISFDFDEEASVFVAGHELLLYRAVSNLIDNAIKYGQNKQIFIYVGLQENCPYVRVRDQGIGISMEQQEKIFESHYRIGNRKKDGYGIGLSLVRHVADLCGGFVWVKSKEGQGAEFKLVFPAFTQD